MESFICSHTSRISWTMCTTFILRMQPPTLSVQTKFSSCFQIYWLFIQLKSGWSGTWLFQRRTHFTTGIGLWHSCVCVIWPIWIPFHIEYNYKLNRRFSVDTILNVAKEVDFPGAGHDDEACYLFKWAEIQFDFMNRYTIQNSNAFVLVAVDSPTITRKSIIWKLKMKTVPL